jgi:hypothetical protein
MRSSRFRSHVANVSRRRIDRDGIQCSGSSSRGSTASPSSSRHGRSRTCSPAIGVATSHGACGLSGSPGVMLPVHVSRASRPPSGSGWLPGIVPWNVKPAAHAARRDPQLPATARQCTRVTAAPHTGVANA